LPKVLEKSIVRINTDLGFFFGKRRELGEKGRDLGEKRRDLGEKKCFIDCV
jgi:hypothetical protein